MITRETCEQIWHCYREISAGEKILADLEKAAKEGRYENNFEPKLEDAFGRLQRLQLGVPSGDSGHTLYSVSANLGVAIIKAHIAAKKTALIEANEKARIELGDPRESK